MYELIHMEKPENLQYKFSHWVPGKTRYSPGIIYETADLNKDGTLHTWTRSSYEDMSEIGGPKNNDYHYSYKFKNAPTSSGDDDEDESYRNRLKGLKSYKTPSVVVKNINI